MARIRTVKPGFFRHGKLYDLERETGLPIRIGFAGLWTAADREGRFRWEPRELKLDCLPHDEVDFARVLDALASRGFIVKYTSNDEVFGFIPGWSRHQIVNNREVASSLPDPQKCVALTREPRVGDASRDCLSNFQVEGKGTGREGKGTIAAPQTALPSLSQSPLDFKKEVWSRGVSFLKNNGVDEETARSMLGKWRKSCDDVAIINALASAEANCVSEPVPYIQQLLVGKVRNGMGSRTGARGTSGDTLRALAAEMGSED